MIMKLMIITYHYTNENDEVNLFFLLISFIGWKRYTHAAIRHKQVADLH